MLFSRDLEEALQRTRELLLSHRNEHGWWEGELASSALATATAITALSLIEEERHAAVIDQGAAWLVKHQNTSGGWGDTTTSKSNLSTSLLCWSALHLVLRNIHCSCPDAGRQEVSAHLRHGISRAEVWLRETLGSLEPDTIRDAVVARYGRDKTFSVPILMLCSLCGTLGPQGWRMVLPLPFELAALPRSWFGAIGLPVVSYALPALIAIGYARHFHAPFAWWNPLRWVKTALWPVISPMLASLQPSSGGYLEATPLTSFVSMALASAGEKFHPCIPRAERFILRSQRADGAWPIDTNLATWGTTLSVKALSYRREGESHSWATPERARVLSWLLEQQYRVRHPFTYAAPGGWAWTDLPGGVPDADDTSSALVALELMRHEVPELAEQLLTAASAGIEWLLDLQNRDGGVPTFCRGWGTLPFDRSTPEITAHALWGIHMWRAQLNERLQGRIDRFTAKAVRYLQSAAHHDDTATAVSWIPLWFGNEHTSDEENPVLGTAKVVRYLIKSGLTARGEFAGLIAGGVRYLLDAQSADGSWGGRTETKPSLEETALVTEALALWTHDGRDDAAAGVVDERKSTDERAAARAAALRGCGWLGTRTENGSVFQAAPIGLYFARLWYHERLYPIIWTLGALEATAACCRQPAPACLSSS